MIDLRSLPKHLSTEDRFEMSYIPEPNSGCWLWIGRECGSNSYGSLRVGRRQQMAHRVSWIIHNGKIPTGMLVLHVCDTPACVNPSHLFLGTHQDNEDDKVRKGRQARGQKLSHPRARGEKNGNCRLTDRQISLILSDARSQRAIAVSYGVTQAAISLIKRGEIRNG